MRRATDLPGDDSVAVQEWAEYLLGGQSSVTGKGGTQVHRAAEKEPKNEHYAAPWVKMKDREGRGLSISTGFSLLKIDQKEIVQNVSI